MASIEVRFRNGDMASWNLREEMDLAKVVKALTRSTGAPRVVSFGAVSEGGGAADFDFVGLAMAEVTSWQVRGMFDATVGAALWAELQSLGEEEDQA